jgi:chaperone BCS1
MDTSFSRELIIIESETYQPRYIINEHSFQWNQINFKIIKCDDFKKSFDTYHQYSELIIEHESITIITTFIEKCSEYILKKLYCDTSKISIYKSLYKNWILETELKQKDMNKIYIPQKIKDDLLLDINNFTDEKVIARYSQLNINHIRMYMFYGPPGTGKTSLIKGIATHFKKNIAYLNIAIDLEDSQLKKCIGNMPDNSILCLEDVDSLFGEERISKNSLTFSGFINIFDGFATPQNLIVFMTTNNLPQLEHAVIRRISYFVEFKYAVKEQIKQMFDTFFPSYSNDFETFYKNIGDINITINILEKFFIKYLFDDIIEASKNFSKFANGELKIELNNCSKLYI